MEQCSNSLTDCADVALSFGHMLLGWVIVHGTSQFILDGIHNTAKLVIAVDVLDKKSSMVVNSEDLVECRIQFVSCSVLELHRRSVSDPLINSSQHGQTVNKHNVHAVDQILALQFDFRWYFHDVFPDNRRFSTGCLSLECTNVRSKYFLGDVNILDSHGTVLDNLLPNDVLVVLCRWASQNMVELSSSLGIFKFAPSVAQSIFFHSGNHVVHCRSTRFRWWLVLFRLGHCFEIARTRFVSIQTFISAFKFHDSSIGVNIKGILHCGVICDSMFLLHVRESKNICNHGFVNVGGSVSAKSSFSIQSHVTGVSAHPDWVVARPDICQEIRVHECCSDGATGVQNDFVSQAREFSTCLLVDQFLVTQFVIVVHRKSVEPAVFLVSVASGGSTPAIAARSAPIRLDGLVVFAAIRGIVFVIVVSLVILHVIHCLIHMPFRTGYLVFLRTFGYSVAFLATAIACRFAPLSKASLGVLVIVALQAFLTGSVTQTSLVLVMFRINLVL